MGDVERMRLKSVQMNARMYLEMGAVWPKKMAAVGIVGCVLVLGC